MSGDLIELFNAGTLSKVFSRLKDKVKESGGTRRKLYQARMFRVQDLITDLAIKEIKEKGVKKSEKLKGSNKCTTRTGPR